MKISKCWVIITPISPTENYFSKTEMDISVMGSKKIEDTEFSRKTETSASQPMTPFSFLFSRSWPIN